jgi:hypothetical protein
VLSSLEIFDASCYKSAIGYRTYMGGIIFGSIGLIVLADFNWIQDFQWWYHLCNSLINSVSWMQFNTGLTRVVSSLESFDG